MQVTIKDNLANKRRAIHEALSKAVRTAALNIEAAAKQKIMDSPASGHMYGKHQASAPGEAPATDQGTLVNSIESKIKDPLHAVVSVSAEYAAYDEYGTANMAARPFLGPAVAEVKPKFEKAVKAALHGK